MLSVITNSDSFLVSSGLKETLNVRQMLLQMFRYPYLAQVLISEHTEQPIRIDDAKFNV